MKKLLFFSVISIIITACSDSEKTDAGTTASNSDMKALYEKNLAVLKASIAAFENEDITGWAAGVSDTAIWNSPAYGDKDTTLAHWKETLQFYVDNWDSIKLNNALFLPGVDNETLDFDGSVRYYGTWDAVHTSGVKTSVNFYGAYNFNSDNKVIFGTEFFDVGGVMSAVQGGSQ